MKELPVEGVFMVHSERSDDNLHTVDFTKPSCTCPDFRKHKCPCKHFCVVFKYSDRWGFSLFRRVTSIDRKLLLKAVRNPKQVPRFPLSISPALLKCLHRILVQQHQTLRCHRSRWTLPHYGLVAAGFPASSAASLFPPQQFLIEAGAALAAVPTPYLTCYYHDPPCRCRRLPTPASFLPRPRSFLSCPFLCLASCNALSSPAPNRKSRGTRLK
ncbi:hypothetical protein HPB51_018071 [Rhipicephalus microplus]|uniref:SWIM-type domain-containing protein n=1 Tax=Rhipicephalus microplus TaxID=6941 RepID=A0A9J6E2U8_RHIMP|nr:hypothetical protein HPB51_018071 [Rhipicephalus microplus]